MATNTTNPNDPARTTTAGDHDENPDLITGSPGSHPAGTGIGAASGAATGAAVGAIGGPVGAVIGGVSGAIVGGLIGHGIGEAVDPTEDAYWREQHAQAGYYNDEYAYDDYEPAYRLGYNAADANKHAPYDADEHDAALEEVYEKRRGESRLDYEEAKPAIRDAYDRRVVTAGGK